MDFSEAVGEYGFAIVPDLFPSEYVDELLRRVEAMAPRRSRAGVRHCMGLAPVAELARNQRMIKMAQEVLGYEAFPYRATLFDKSSQSNWLVVWHQDKALPVLCREDIDGWGPWSTKDGVEYAHAPCSVLGQVLALRLHLDESTAGNGPLRVLPRTHQLGVLSDVAVEQLSSRIDSEPCLCAKGGVIAMRPLLVHASSKSRLEIPRRVLHIEYAASAVIAHPFHWAIA